MVRSSVATARALPRILTYWEVMDERAKMLRALKRVLREVDSEHALIGGLAVGYHGRWRATIDVDLLVPRRKLARIARVLEARGYTVRRLIDFIRVWPPGADVENEEPGADLVAREAHPVLRAAAAETESASILGSRMDVVTRGALVALKFHSAISPTRRIEDKYQDVSDIGRVIRKALEDEDVALALRIARRLHLGADEELRTLIEDLRAGRKVQI